MSRAFTKEDDGSGAEVLPDLPHSDHPNNVTLGGLASLQTRLHDTRAALAGLRAGAVDIETRTPIAMAERDIRFLEERIRRAIPIDPRDQPPGIVAFGAEVEVIDEDGAPRTYRIVGEDEADPGQGLTTPFSPLGRCADRRGCGRRGGVGAASWCGRVGGCCGSVWVKRGGEAVTRHVPKQFWLSSQQDCILSPTEFRLGSTGGFDPKGGRVPIHHFRPSHQRI